MTEERLPLAELLAKAGDGDFLRSVAEAVMASRQKRRPLFGSIVGSDARIARHDSGRRHATSMHKSNET